MVDLDEIREREWLKTDWANQIGLSTLAADSVIAAIATSQKTWPNLNEGNLDAFRVAECRVMLTWVQPNDLERTFSKFEAILKVGNATELGMWLCRSPHRYDARCVSILSSNARMIPNASFQ